MGTSPSYNEHIVVHRKMNSKVTRITWILMIQKSDARNKCFEVTINFPSYLPKKTKTNSTIKYVLLVS